MSYLLRTITAAFVGLLGSISLAPANDPATTGFLDKVYKDTAGKEYKYVVFIPHDYKGDKAYPLILFLHGAGETGTDGKKQTMVGIGPAIRKREKTFPFIVVMPQASDTNVAVRTRWHDGSPDAKRALAIVEEVQKAYKVDDKRLYLTGLSMGGFGSWSLAAKNPKKFAAVAPICGGADLEWATALKDVPIWNFHGDADKAVPVKLSRDIIEAIKKAGGNPKYTEYPKVGHNSWDAAYGTDELYDWFLKHTTK